MTMMVERNAQAFVRAGQPNKFLTQLEQLLLMTLDDETKGVKLPQMHEMQRSRLRVAWKKFHPTTRLVIRKTIDAEFIAWVEPQEEV